MQEKINESEMSQDYSGKEIALMFSGGLDTTTAAATLAKVYRRIHLLTFCNGICIRVNASKVHAGELKEKFGSDKFIHRIIYIADLFAQIRKGLKKYLKKYKSPLIFDLCCRLSMEVTTIIYCLENNILYASDGNNPAQDTIFLQQPKYLCRVEAFFKEHGIECIHPVDYFEERCVRTDNLKKLGFNSGNKLLEKIGITSQLANQPFCLWAFIAFFFTSWMRHNPIIKKYSLPLDAAIEFRCNREKIARSYIQRYFEGKKIRSCIVVLPATQKGFSAVTAIRGGKKDFEIIPVPVKPDCCGVAIRFDYQLKDEIADILDKEGVDWKLIEE